MASRKSDKKASKGQSKAAKSAPKPAATVPIATKTPPAVKSKITRRPPIPVDLPPVKIVLPPPELAVAKTQRNNPVVVKPKARKTPKAKAIPPPEAPLSAIIVEEVSVLAAPIEDPAPQEKPKSRKSRKAKPAAPTAPTAPTVEEIAPVAAVSAAPVPEEMPLPESIASVLEAASDNNGISEHADSAPGSETENSVAAVEPPQEPSEYVPSETAGAASGDALTTDAEAAKEPDEPEEPAAPPDMAELARTVEALLFAAEEPLAVREMARAAGTGSATMRKVLKQVKEALDQQRKAWELIEVAGGYRLMTRPEFFPAIERLKTQTAQRKLTQAALETLALIAYRQPLGRAEVESVRGVGAGPVLRLLLDKKLIKISGRGTGIGQPLLYGTTDYFLEHFGLKTIEELPKPGEFKA